ncbi:hypothetical protein RCL1_000480 [Eukaryota sp. TZLM3-RCL]
MQILGLDSTLLLLLTACTIYIFLLICFLSRVLGLIVTLLLYLFGPRTQRIRIKRIRFGLLAGLIKCTDVHIISKSSTLRISALDVRYMWSTKPFSSSQPRLNLTLKGLQVVCFNNVKKYDALKALIAKRIHAKEQRLIALKNGNFDFSRQENPEITLEDILSALEIPLPIFSSSPSLPDPSFLSSFYKLVPITGIKISNGAIILGNNSLPYSLITRFSAAVGSHEVCETPQVEDPYRVVTKLSMSGLNVKMAENQDYKPPVKKTRSSLISTSTVHFAGTPGFTLRQDSFIKIKEYLNSIGLSNYFEELIDEELKYNQEEDFFKIQSKFWSEIDQYASNETIAECSSVTFIYYYDIAGVQQSNLIDSQDQVDPFLLLDQTPAYGVELRFTSPLKLTYGPFTDRIRNNIMRFYLPLYYDTRKLYKVPDVGDPRLYLFLNISLKFEAGLSLNIPFRRMLQNITNISSENSKCYSTVPYNLKIEAGPSSSLSFLQQWYDLSSSGTISLLNSSLRNVSITIQDPLKGEDFCTHLLHAPALEIKGGMSYPRQWNGNYRWVFNLNSSKSKIIYMSDLLDIVQDLAADFQSHGNKLNLSTYCPTEYHFKFNFKDLQLIMNATRGNIVFPGKTNSHADQLHTKAVLKVTKLEGNLTSPMILFNPLFVQHSFNMSLDSCSFTLQCPKTSAILILSSEPSSTFLIDSIIIDGLYKGHYAIRPENIDKFALNVGIKSVSGGILGWELYVAKQILTNYFGTDASPIPLNIYTDNNCTNLYAQERFQRKSRWGNGEIKKFNKFQSAIEVELSNLGVALSSTVNNNQSILIECPELSFVSNSLDGNYQAIIAFNSLTLSDNLVKSKTNKTTSSLSISEFNLTQTGYYSPWPVSNCYFYSQNLNISSISGDPELNFLTNLGDATSLFLKSLALPALNDPCPNMEFVNGNKSIPSPFSPFSKLSAQIDDVSISVVLPDDSLLALALADGLLYTSEVSIRNNRTNISALICPDIAIKLLTSPVEFSRLLSKSSSVSVIDLTTSIVLSQIGQDPDLLSKENNFKNWLKECDSKYNRLNDIDSLLTSEDLYEQVNSHLSSFYTSPHLNLSNLSDDLSSSSSSSFDSRSIKSTATYSINEFETAKEASDLDSISDVETDRSSTIGTESSRKAGNLDLLLVGFHDHYDKDFDLVRERHRSEYVVFEGRKSRFSHEFSRPFDTSSTCFSSSIVIPNFSLFISPHSILPISNFLNGVQSFDLQSIISRAVTDYGISQYPTPTKSINYDSAFSVVVSNCLVEVPCSAFHVDVPVVRNISKDVPSIKAVSSVYILSAGFGDFSLGLIKRPNNSQSIVANLDTLFMDLTSFENTSIVLDSVIPGHMVSLLKTRLSSGKISMISPVPQEGSIKIDCSKIELNLFPNIYSNLIGLQQEFKNRQSQFNSLIRITKLKISQELLSNLIINRLISSNSSFGSLSHPQRIRTLYSIISVLNKSQLNAFKSIVVDKSDKSIISNSTNSNRCYNIDLNWGGIELIINTRNLSESPQISLLDFKLNGNYGDETHLSMSFSDAKLVATPLVTSCLVSLKAQLDLPNEDEENLQLSDDENIELLQPEVNPFSVFSEFHTPLMSSPKASNSPFFRSASPDTEVLEYSNAVLGLLKNFDCSRFDTESIDDTEILISQKSNFSSLFINFSFNSCALVMSSESGSQSLVFSDLGVKFVQNNSVQSIFLTLDSFTTKFFFNDILYDFGFKILDLNILFSNSSALTLKLDKISLDIPLNSEYWMLPKTLLEDFSPSSYKLPSILQEIKKETVDLHSQVNSDVKASVIRIYHRHRHSLPVKYTKLLDKISQQAAVSDESNLTTLPVSNNQSQQSKSFTVSVLISTFSISSLFERTYFSLTSENSLIKVGFNPNFYCISNIAPIKLEFVPVSILNSSSQASSDFSISSAFDLTDESNDELFSDSDSDLSLVLDGNTSPANIPSKSAVFISFGKDNFELLSSQKRDFSLPRICCNLVKNNNFALCGWVLTSPMTNTITTDVITYIAQLQSKLIDEWNNYSVKISSALDFSQNYKQDAKELLNASSNLDFSFKCDLTLIFSSITVIVPTPASSAGIRLSTIKIKYSNVSEINQFLIGIDKIKIELTNRSIIVDDSCETQSSCSFKRPQSDVGSNILSDTVISLSRNDLICLEFITGFSFSNSISGSFIPNMTTFSLSLGKTSSIIRPGAIQSINLLSSAFTRAYASAASRRALSTLAPGFSTADLQNALDQIKQKSKESSKKYLTQKSFLLSLTTDSVSFVLPTSFSNTKVSKTNPLSAVLLNLDRISISSKIILNQQKNEKIISSGQVAFAVSQALVNTILVNQNIELKHVSKLSKSDHLAHSIFFSPECLLNISGEFSNTEIDCLIRITCPPCIFSFNEKSIEIFYALYSKWSNDLINYNDNSNSINDSSSINSASFDGNSNSLISDSVYLNGMEESLFVVPPVSSENFAKNLNLDLFFNFGGLSVSVCNFTNSKFKKSQDLSIHSIKYPQIQSISLPGFSISASYDLINSADVAVTQASSSKISLTFTSPFVTELSPQLSVFAANCLKLINEFDDFSATSYRFSSNESISKQIQGLKKENKLKHKQQTRAQIKAEHSRRKVISNQLKNSQGSMVVLLSIPAVSIKLLFSEKSSSSDNLTIKSDGIILLASSTLSEAVVCQCVTINFKNPSISLMAPLMVSKFSISNISCNLNTIRGFLPSNITSGTIVCGSIEADVSLPNLSLINAALLPWISPFNTSKKDSNIVRDDVSLIENSNTEETLSKSTITFLELKTSSITIKSDLGPELGQLKFIVGSINSRSQLSNNSEDILLNSKLLLIDNVSVSCSGCLHLASSFKQINFVFVDDFSSSNSVPKYRIQFDHITVDAEFEVNRILYYQLNHGALYSTPLNNSNSALIISNGQLVLSALTVPSLLIVSERISRYFDLARIVPDFASNISSQNSTRVTDYFSSKVLNKSLPCAKFTLLTSDFVLGIFARSLRDPDFIALVGEEIVMSFTRNVTTENSNFIVQRAVDLTLKKNELSKMSIRNQASDDISVRLLDPHSKFLVKIPETQLAFLSQVASDSTQIIGEIESKFSSPFLIAFDKPRYDYLISTMKTFASRLPSSSGSQGTSSTAHQSNDLEYSFGLSFSPAIQFLGNHKIPVSTFLSQLSYGDPKENIPKVIQESIVPLLETLISTASSLV